MFTVQSLTICQNEEVVPTFMYLKILHIMLLDISFMEATRLSDFNRNKNKQKYTKGRCPLTPHLIEKAVRSSKHGSVLLSSLHQQRRVRHWTG